MPPALQLCIGLMPISDSKKWLQLFLDLETKSGHMGYEELLQVLEGLLKAIPGKNLGPRFPRKPGKILRKGLNLGWEISRTAQEALQVLGPGIL